MNEFDLAAIRARCDAATPGPWLAATSNRRKDGYGVVGRTEDRGTGKAIAVFAGEPKWRTADAKFTAAARSDVPDLLAEVERLRARIAGMIGAVAEVGKTAEAGTEAERIADRCFMAAYETAAKEER